MIRSGSLFFEKRQERIIQRSSIISAILSERAKTKRVKQRIPNPDFLIPNAVSLLIPTPQCPVFGTVLFYIETLTVPKTGL